MSGIVDLGERAAVRRLAREIKSRTGQPTLHKGEVTAVTYVTPSAPTCRVKLDGATAEHPQDIRFSQDAWPIIGDKVEILEFQGDLWVTGILQKQGWIDAVLNGGSTWLTTYNKPSYRRIASGLVEIKGGLMLGAAVVGTTLFSVVGGYAPLKQQVLHGLYWTGSTHAPAVLTVSTTGNVVVNTARNSDSLHLDGCFYTLVGT